MQYRRGSLLLLAVLALAAGGCRTVRRAPALSDDTEARRLSHLAEAYWDFLMRESPLWATFLGDRRFDSELPDLSAGHRERARDELQRLLEGVESLDPDKLSEPDRITRETLRSLLSNELGTHVCREELWDVNALDGAQAALAEIPALHALGTPEQGKAMVIRYLRAGVLIDQHLDNLRRGLEEGYRAPRLLVERVLTQLDELLGRRPEESTFLTAVQLPEPWRDEEKRELRKELLEAVRSAVYPALARYRDFLRDEYLAQARDAVGLSANEGGARCYAAKLEALTGLNRSPEEIHQLGLTELARNEAQMRELARRLTGSDDLDRLEAQLAQSPRQHLRTPEELLEYNRLLVERARAAASRAFGRLPAQRVEVRPIDAHREQDSPPGYYFQGSRAQDRPGYYFLNTYDAPNRLLFQMEPLAFHETIPGHHLQIALAQELERLPRFRKELGDPAFKEGWAHYAELLADELDLYSSDEGRFGMLSDQALRAARLVVDTGLHALGWSREQAIAFLVDHTAESPASAAREVDRYIAWPAQALGYKLGQLEILALRREAQERLGKRFDLKVFHDRLLANGAVPLPVLRQVMSRWLDEASRAGSSAPQPRTAAHR